MPPNPIRPIDGAALTEVQRVRLVEIMLLFGDEAIERINPDDLHHYGVSYGKRCIARALRHPDLKPAGGVMLRDLDRALSNMGRRNDD